MISYPQTGLRKKERKKKKKKNETNREVEGEKERKMFWNSSAALR